MPDGTGGIKTCSLMEWATWMESPATRRPFRAGGRIVRKTPLPGGVEVSTVFLGLDQRFDEGGPPVLFETMVFPECDRMERYCTLDEAEQGHENIIAELTAGVE